MSIAKHLPDPEHLLALEPEELAGLPRAQDPGGPNLTSTFAKATADKNPDTVVQSGACYEPMRYESAGFERAARIA